MRRLLLCALLIGGCRDLTDPDGKGDGRNGSANAQLAPLTDIAVGSAITGVGDVLYRDCEGVELLVPLNKPLDLVSGDRIPVQPGDWCDVQIQLNQFIKASGTALSGQAWTLELRTQFIALGGGQSFRLLDDRPYVLEFGNERFFTEDDLGPIDTGNPGVTVMIQQGHPAYDALNEAITLKSALFEDDNYSGVVDGSERISSLVARGPNRPAQ